MPPPSHDRVPALGVDHIRRKRVGRGVIENLGVCPSARIRESVGILFARARASMVAISRPGFRVRATLRWREVDANFHSPGNVP